MPRRLGRRRRRRFHLSGVSRSPPPAARARRCDTDAGVSPGLPPSERTCAGARPRPPHPARPPPARSMRSAAAAPPSARARGAPWRRLSGEGPWVANPSEGRRAGERPSDRRGEASAKMTWNLRLRSPSICKASAFLQTDTWEDPKREGLALSLLSSACSWVIRLLMPRFRDTGGTRVEFNVVKNFTLRIFQCPSEVFDVRAEGK